MLEKYEYLNVKSRKYLIRQLAKHFDDKFHDKGLFKRCEREIDILYQKGTLFIIEYLYKFKELNKNVDYYFKGTTNNLLFLYVLDLNKVNPVEYNLPYELFNDSTINVEVDNASSLDLVYYLEKQANCFKIVSGFFVKEDYASINDFLLNHYLLLPCKNIDCHMLLRFNRLNILETINDYRDYKNDYLTVRIADRVWHDNILTNEFEKELAQILKPKNISDYVKIKTISHGTNVWIDNQDILVKEGKINIDNLIASREDILKYLLDHSIPRDTALDIYHFIRKALPTKDLTKWQEYVNLMKLYKCEDIFIDIFSKILFISGKGEALSECLAIKDKDSILS